MVALSSNVNKEEESIATTVDDNDFDEATMTALDAGRWWMAQEQNWIGFF